MFIIIINIIKVVFLLGFLIFIHEGGHFIAAKICKVKVNEFSIGFGPTILKKQGKETKYALRAIPLGGFVSMEGEIEKSCEDKSFNNAKISKRIFIVAAGALINILFGIILYFILVFVLLKNFNDAILSTGGFISSIFQSLKMLFTGNVGINDLTGPVGISEVVIQATTFSNYVYLLSLVSLSLGVTNLLPIPALDGGKIVLLIIEAIRKKPIDQITEAKIQLFGFSLIIALSIIVGYNDVIKIIQK